MTGVWDPAGRPSPLHAPVTATRGRSSRRLKAPNPKTLLRERSVDKPPQGLKLGGAQHRSAARPRLPARTTGCCRRRRRWRRGRRPAGRRGAETAGRCRGSICGCRRCRERAAEVALPWGGGRCKRAFGPDGSCSSSHALSGGGKRNLQWVQRQSGDQLFFCACAAACC